MRQMLATITERRRLQAWTRHQEVVAQTRTICQFIAATVPVADGQTNTLMAAAERIGEPATGGVAGDPVPGSYEALTRMFGGGADH